MPSPAATAFPLAQAHVTLIRWCQQPQRLTGTQNQATDTIHTLDFGAAKNTADEDDVSD